jgi:O-antigen ligase
VGSGRHGSIHDIYVGVLAEEGLFGITLLGAIYFNILLTFIRKYSLRHQGNHFALYIMPPLGGALIAYLVGGIAFDYRYFATLPGLFFFYAGIIAGYQPTQLRAPANTNLIDRNRRMG